MPETTLLETPLPETSLPDRNQPTVAIVGAGLSGALLATLLARRGMTVTLYERRSDPRVAGAEQGRSINLALSARGLDAVDRIGLREKVLDHGLPMRGRMIHAATADGSLSLRPYSADGKRAINSISRSELNALLLDAAEATPGVTIEFEHRLTGLDLKSGSLTFDRAGTSGNAHADIVLAADGSYSVARQTVTHSTGFNYSQDYLDAGYREMVIPAHDGEFALDPGALHIWPRGESMMIALPNLDRSFTCTLFWPREQLEALQTDEEIDRYFREHYPDAVDLMPTLLEDFRTNPIGSLVTVRCWPWVHRGDGCTLALVGDAAHAIVPFYGQGANCALEDCVEIADCLAEYDGDWQHALAAYQERRKANAEAIADMALENFVEMRDKVNSTAFRAATASQHALERWLPGRYVSRYELVSFSTMPYADVLTRMKRQNQATTVVAAGAALFGGFAAGLWRRRRSLQRGR